MADGKPTYIPIHYQPFISDVRVSLMSTEQIGAYFLLLVNAWQEKPAGSLPDDHAKLAKWARVSFSKWTKIGPAILECWRLEDGRWYSDRLAHEYAKSIKRMEIARNNGKAGGRPPKEPSGLSENNPAGSDPVSKTEPSGLTKGDWEIKRLGDSSEKTVKPKTRTATPSLCEIVWAKCTWRKVGKADALKAIAKSIRLVADAKACSDDEAAKYVAQRAEAFSVAMAGSDVHYLPHPSTWFNRGSYDDDPSGWTKGGTQPVSPKDQARAARQAREPEQEIRINVLKFGEST